MLALFANFLTCLSFAAGLINLRAKIIRIAFYRIYTLLKQKVKMLNLM